MFSKTAEYALRALVHLSREPGGCPVLGHRLAERAQIPANYLAKILWTLGHTGILEATRGHGGGYRLARPADEITLLEIVRQFDGVYAEPGCLLGESHECSDDSPCSAHHAWKQVKERYLEFIRETTIAEIGDTAGTAPEPEARRRVTERPAKRRKIAKRK